MWGTDSTHEGTIGKLLHIVLDAMSRRSTILARQEITVWDVLAASKSSCFSTTETAVTFSNTLLSFHGLKRCRLRWNFASQLDLSRPTSSRGRMDDPHLSR